MALRYYIEPTTLRGEDWRLEIHDTDWESAAAEINGDSAGFVLDYEGDASDPFNPVFPSSLTFNFLVETAGHETFLNTLAGAREERFSVVLKRGAGLPVDWVGFIVTDQIQQRDAYFPYHTTLYAVDGFARMKDREYRDFTTGDPYTGRVTLLEHLYNCIEHINLMGIVTMPATRFRSNCNLYSEDMVTTTDPLAQAEIDHARFYEKDNEGKTTYFTVFDVMESICRLFGARLLFTRGAYTFMQTGEMDNATQKFRKFDEDGLLIGTDTGVDIDIDIDYSTEAGAKKRAGGNYTYLQALKEACVDYHHVTSNNRAIGVSYNSVNGPLIPTTLPGAVVVDADDTTNIEFIINFSVRTTNLDPANVGYSSYPPHRYKFRVTLKLGTIHLKRNITVSNIYDIQPEDAIWSFSTEYVEVFSPIINQALEGQEVPFQLKINTPYLLTSYNNLPISIEVELQHIAGPAIPSTLVEMVTQFPPTFAWKTEAISLIVKEEGFGSNPDFETLRHCAYDSEPGNTLPHYIDTHFGDGPQPYSLSRITVDGDNTALWKIGGTGTGYPINERLARDVMAIRQIPLRVFQGTLIDKGFYPYYRFVDGSNAYWPLRLSLSAFTDEWSGEFVKIGRVFTPAVIDPPFPPHVPLPGPVVPQPPPKVPLSPFTSPVDVYTILDAIGLAELDGEAVASVVNTPDPNELTIDPASFAFAKAGDKFKLIDPGSGKSQLVTIAEDYVPFSTTLKITEDLTDDYPHKSMLVAAFKYMTGSPTGFTQQLDSQTGTFVTVTLGTLPDPAVVSATEIKRRVKVFRSGIRVAYNTADGYTITYATNRINFADKLRSEHVIVEVSS